MDLSSSPEARIASEIDSFEEEIGRFRRGETPKERFGAYLRSFGIYGQRQPGVQMVRIKIPAGDCTAAQLRELGMLAGDIGHGTAHFTTRQDVQLYFIPLERVPDLLRRIARCGLTTREACGDNVRNVTCCPLAGVLAEEWFDVTPYAHAVTHYLIRHPFCQRLSRKFKIAFSACPEDCIATSIHDIGLRAAVREEDGRLRAGFRVASGGGLGTTPFLAKALADFVPLEGLLPLLHSILVVFADQGNRRSRAKARLKFVVERLGVEAFRREVEAASNAMSAVEREEADLRYWVRESDRSRVQADLEGRLHPPSLSAAPYVAENGDFPLWMQRNVRAHRESDRAIVTVQLPLGDIEGRRLCGLAELVAGYAGGAARTTIAQNLVLPSVPRERLRALFHDLENLSLSGSEVGTARDVVSCPGADSCSLAITSSKGLARAIQEVLAPMDPVLAGISIKISGCPNACGQHQVGNIGLHGAAKKVGGRLLPHYQLFLGGRIGNGDSALGDPVQKIPARRTPDAVRALITAYADARSASESFPDWVGRTSRREIADLLAPFLIPPDADDDSAARDWGSEADFNTDAIQAKTLAAADPGEDRFGHVETELRDVEAFLAREQAGDALAILYRSLFTSARVLLAALDKQPDSDWEVLHELRAHVIDRGYAGDDFNELLEEVRRLRERKVPRVEGVSAALDSARELLPEFREVLPLLLALPKRSGHDAEVPA